jgi:hypothetical protein
LDKRKGFLIGCAIGMLLFLCVGGLAVFGAGVYFARDIVVNNPELLEIPESNTTPTATPQLLLSTPTTGQPNTGIGAQTLLTLEEALVPENNPADLAMRLLGIDFIPETQPDPNAPYQVGDLQDFWITNTATNVSSQVTAILRYETPHSYFWIEEDVSYRESDLRELAETFENEIYPTNREFFGSEWTPGIDEDPHIYILYTPGIGFGTAGYFSSSDSVHPLAHEYSNAHEMFVFNSENSPLGSTYTAGVLAHEFQHMIHWYRDRNETSWINEGFSEVAMLLNGYDSGGFDYVYTANPDWQLNDWDPGGNTSANYGSAFLYLAYFLDRFGSDLTQEIVFHPENGFKSIDAVLAENNITDPLTGLPIHADDVVLDWVLTNYLLDKNVGDGRFDYVLHADAPQAYETETQRDCDGAPQLRDVAQYGVDYIRITCEGSYTLNFSGSQVARLLPVDAYSGDFFWWSNKGDESNMTLTQQFDLSAASGSLTFSYRTWYDIETDYDYLYLEASTDGENWQILTTPSGTGADPTGNSYGWGYNAESEGWIEEQVDISAYAGGPLWLRFEYVTDAAVHGEGLLLDDLTIPEIGYFSDLEEDGGGWEGAGFVRVSNQLPQTFRLGLISIGADTSVEYLTLDSDNLLSLPLEIGGDVDEVVLVVVASTRYTRQRASYQVEIALGE